MPTLIDLTAREFYATIGGSVVLLAALQWFLMTWFKSRIEESIKSEYARNLEAYKLELNKQLEDYRNDAKIREQAAKVAEFLAFVRWNQKDIKGEEFDKRAWELSLWLPTEIYIEVAKCLAGDENAKHMKQILIDVRKHLLKDKAGTLIADNILHCANPQETK
jgi:hypothetical protein